MNKNNKPLFEYECWHDDEIEWCKQRYIAYSHGNAKKQHYDYLQDGIWEDSFFNVIRDMKCRKIGIASISSFYGDSQQFEHMKLSREIPFAYIGQKVKVCNKIATIVGSNESMNLDVVFNGEFRKSNVHPTWDITYYDSNGVICFDSGVKQ